MLFLLVPIVVGLILYFTKVRKGLPIQGKIVTTKQLVLKILVFEIAMICAAVFINPILQKAISQN